MSIASVALGHGLNADMLPRWVIAGLPTLDPPALSSFPVTAFRDFVAVAGSPVADDRGQHDAARVSPTWR